MKTPCYLLAIACLFFILASCNVNQTPQPESTLLWEEIDSMRIAFNFPAVAYGVIRNDSILVANAVGYRDIESKVPVNLSDYFHIGSCTKSFTAFLAGKLVEEGLLTWETRFFDLFPELLDSSDPAYHDMTLRQLLAHRARINSFKEDGEVSSIIARYRQEIPENTNLVDRRYYCVAHILTYEPQYPDLPRSQLYSNAGYMAAGLMLEKVSNKTWEELIMEMSDELGLGIQIKTITTNLFLENSSGVVTNIEDFGGSIGLFAKYKFSPANRKIHFSLKSSKQLLHLRRIYFQLK